ncbi:hypothetical protein NQ318_008397 [Aromia moschata]|uniref:Peptidase aspartic putative domain-containing protein n=1 Tax=Aromia moschata TaxID=1265417 RepID=A0AAV8YII0_9CUCU|nr:hypothetical protein NQ318_008397 [Aromia moschata]
MCVGQINLSTRGPILQKSRFGWIVAGSIPSSTAQTSHCNLSQNIGLEKQLTRFWEVEEIPLSNLCRVNKLGNSYETAKNRFSSLERKFVKYSELKNSATRNSSTNTKN